MFAMMLTRNITSVISVAAAALAGCIAVHKYTQQRRHRRSSGSGSNSNNNGNNGSGGKSNGEISLRHVYSYSEPSLPSVGFLFRLFGWVVRRNATIVLRTANRQDAVLYHSQLTALQQEKEQQQLQCRFTLEVEEAAHLHGVLVIEARIQKGDNDNKEEEEEKEENNNNNNNKKERSALQKMCMKEMESLFDESVATTAAALSSLYNRQESLVLCRIPIPDLRVYRDLPPVIPRLLAALADNRRLFPTYAEELLYYLPYIERYKYQQRKQQQQQQQHTVASTMMVTTIRTTTTTRRAAAPTTTTTTMMTTMTSSTTTTTTTSSSSAAAAATTTNAGMTSTSLEIQDEGNCMDASLTSSTSLPLKEDTCSIASLLGDLIDVNATMFSTSLFVDFSDTTNVLRCGTGETSTGFFIGEDQFIYNAIHEAFFQVVLRTPLTSPQVSAADNLRKYPFKVWHMSRRSRRAAAELYVIDVAAAKGDPLICQTRVVDEVVAQAVLVHHRGSLLEFVEALHARFALIYTPVNPTLRACVEQRRGGNNNNDDENDKNEPQTPAEEEYKQEYECGRDGVDGQSEEITASSGVGGGIHTMRVGKISAEGNGYYYNNDAEPSLADGEKEKETKEQQQQQQQQRENEEEEKNDGEGNSTVSMRDVLEELIYLREFILKHRITFYNAVLTAAGSNLLEEVFGVPATVFPFLPCARESVAFVTCVFDCILSTYGPLNFHNFTKYAHDVFVRDRPEIVRHAPRIFRALNKTRTGVISFEELCCWMARKLSSGMLLRPDAHLIAIAMSLRLPLALLMDRRQQWSRMECALSSLSDADADGY
ncbi:uncharacterized protein TM35_000361730 [Trypanosoma theileri]|uniref:EF-hand domain-containing protein n=1 Tax=Trypanosoma theileri TaxID=67003 RepID=A0A1X0NLI1_9TRYP|nr:uncharacterized protein TM35_000361730 [Trypanosoma theileri]ORC85313.1 hypothetical protein TM35_000361730 [Trypanosoma theileri]